MAGIKIYDSHKTFLDAPLSYRSNLWFHLGDMNIQDDAADNSADDDHN